MIKKVLKFTRNRNMLSQTIFLSFIVVCLSIFCFFTAKEFSGCASKIQIKFVRQWRAKQFRVPLSKLDHVTSAARHLMIFYSCSSVLFTMFGIFWHEWRTTWEKFSVCSSWWGWEEGAKTSVIARRVDWKNICEVANWYLRFDCYY